MYCPLEALLAKAMLLVGSLNNSDGRYELVVAPAPVVCQVANVLVPCAYNPNNTVPLNVVVAVTDPGAINVAGVLKVIAPVDADTVI